MEFFGYMGRVINAILHISDIAPNPTYASAKHMSEEKYVATYVSLLEQFGEEVCARIY